MTATKLCVVWGLHVLNMYRVQGLRMRFRVVGFRLKVSGFREKVAAGIHIPAWCFWHSGCQIYRDWVRGIGFRVSLMFGFENQGCSFSFPILGASEHFTFPKITWKPERVSRQTAVELQAVCMGFHLPRWGEGNWDLEFGLLENNTKV